MASKFKKKAEIKDTEGSGFGTYQEENGGGSPKGGIWGGKSGRVGWSNREKSGEVGQGEHREDQPRDAGGRFTYNSVNGKETKYESRGKTVNPLLLGDRGKKSVLISDAETQFAAKKGDLYDKFKDKWYQAGSEKITKEGRKFKTVAAKHNIWEIARVSFNLSKGGFEFEDTNWQVKKGRRSADENAARAIARHLGEETWVTNTNGEIAVKKGVTSPGGLSTGIPFDGRTIMKKVRAQQLRNAVAGQQSAISSITGSGVQPQPSQAAAPQPQVTLAHSPQQIQAFKNILAKQGVDVSKFTDQQISGILSKRVKK